MCNHIGQIHPTLCWIVTECTYCAFRMNSRVHINSRHTLLAIVSWNSALSSQLMHHASCVLLVAESSLPSSLPPFPCLRHATRLRHFTDVQTTPSYHHSRPRRPHHQPYQRPHSRPHFPRPPRHHPHHYHHPQLHRRSKTHSQ